MTSTTSGDEHGSAAQRERRRRILDAAVALASDGGYDAVQMRAVAERADVALGTLYRYFPSKIHLLVTVLGREFERADASLRDGVAGDTAAERVLAVLRRTNRGLQGDPRLTEALTRAFMFADRSVSEEIDHVTSLVTGMLARAAHPGVVDDPEAAVVARVIGDVWLASLVAWVNGRSTAAATAQHLETTVRLLLRDPRDDA